jgi:ADP-heptose:LPS heptosyltransferase
LIVAKVYSFVSANINQILLGIGALLVFLKKALIKTRLGRIVDSKLRIGLNVVLSRVLFRPESDTRHQKNYVFFLYGGIGDITVDASLIESYRKTRNLRCAVVFPRDYQQVFDSLGFGFESYTYSKHRILIDAIKLRKNLKGKNFILHHLSFETQVVAKLAGCNIVAGFYSDYQRIKLPNGTIRRLDYESYQRHMRVKKLLSITFGDLPTPDPKILIKKQVLALLLTKSGNKRASGTFELETWMGIIAACIEADITKIILLGDSGGTEISDQIEKKVKGNTKLELENLVGKCSLSHSITQLKSSDLAVGLDSGLSHLASALGIPILKLFYFSKPNDFVWGSNADFIFNPKISCMPCVSESVEGIDNYPVICKVGYKCTKSINFGLAFEKTKDFLKKNEYLIS